jgi:hypothetical protein
MTVDLVDKDVVSKTSTKQYTVVFLRLDDKADHPKSLGRD